MRIFRLVGAPVVAMILFAGSSPTLAATPRKGQLCAAVAVGTSGKDASGNSLTCATDAKGKNRWGVAGSATTVKTVTTKAKLKKAKTTTTKPATTKPGGATTKSSTPKSSTATSKSTGSSGATGTVVIVKGRFCKKADDGVTGNDKNAVKLVCKADAQGKNRWQLA